MIPGDENPHSSDEKEVEEDDGSTQMRITQQLQTLQSLIPNMTKMDKRSVLEGAHDYLQRIHEETKEIEKELSQRSESGSSSEGSVRRILRVEVEKLVEGRFVLKISWRGFGVAGDVQRVIECLEVDMTSIVVNEKNPGEMLTTAFVKVKDDKMGISEEELHDLIMSAATRLGLI